MNWSLSLTIMLLCVSNVATKIAILKVLDVQNYHNCNFETIGYAPGGELKRVDEIKAPSAEIQEHWLQTVVEKSETGINGLQSTAEVATEIYKLMEKVGPKLVAGLGAFGVAANVIAGFAETSPEDIFARVNEALEQLTREVNEKFKQMEEYVDQRVLMEAKVQLDDHFSELARSFFLCIESGDKEEALTCMRDAFRQLKAARLRYMFGESWQEDGTRPNIFNFKKMEIKLQMFREYVGQFLLESSTLMGTYEDFYKNATSAKEKDKYKTFLKQSAVDITMCTASFVNYSRYAVDLIKEYHTKGNCDYKAITCTKTKEWWEGVPFKRHTADQYKCECLVDPVLGESRSCFQFLYQRMDLTKPKGYQTVSCRQHWNPRVCKSSEYLKPRTRIYNEKILPYLTAFWNKELLDLVPRWEAMASVAQQVIEDYNLQDVPSNDFCY